MANPSTSIPVTAVDGICTAAKPVRVSWANRRPSLGGLLVNPSLGAIKSLLAGSRLVICSNVV